jgi:4-hydroxy-tetrahydrodipicolinate synthase
MTPDWDFYAIVPTQFSHERDLDAESTAVNVERAVELGVSRFLLTGAYGEFQSLADDERVALVEAVRARCPNVVIMTGAVHPSTDATLQLVNRLFDAGTDEVMVGPPAMAESTDLDILRHFDHLARNSDGPLVLYNNPVFGHDVSPAHISELAQMSAFSAIKQGTTSIHRFVESVSAAHAGPRPLRLLAASDVIAVATLSSGADGLTSTNFWAFPEPILALAGSLAAGDRTRAMSIHGALTPYFAHARALGQPRAIKAAMLFRGFVGTPAVRLPYAPLSEVERRGLEETILAVDSALSALGQGREERAS